MKKIVLLGFVLLFLCIANLLKLQTAHASPYMNIDVGTAYNMITNGSYPNLVVLDVRTQSEYDDGHIYGAVWIPHTELETRINELAGQENHEIIAYCKSGFRSANASNTLDSHNFTKVYNMLGGILAWENAGYPVWNATVHNINTTFNYDTIQAAIDAFQTLDEHTILVDAGTYYEHVNITKSVSLVGKNGNSVIDGNGTGAVLQIAVYNVNVTGFTIRNGTEGIYIEDSNYNTISGNIITDNQHGIYLYATCSCSPTRENTIRNNIIKNNRYGVYLSVSTDNLFYHNNFVNNTKHKYYYQYEFYSNVWDNGFPSGGNYWSNYTGIDLYSGQYQNETGSDGTGDSPHAIDENNQDNYPLMGVFSSFNTSLGHYVNVISNSTIVSFQYLESNSTIKMHVSNMTANQMYGFCRINIPHALMNETYHVIIDGVEPFYVNYALYDDGSNRWIYFSYQHSTIEIIIIPEFPLWNSVLLLLILLTVATTIYNRKLLKTPIH